MKGVFFFWSFVLFSGTAKGQAACFQKSDTLLPKRAVFTGVGTGVIWSGGTIGLSQIWYKEYPKSDFHFFRDGHNWLQMDKAGHFYTANRISFVATSAFEWAGCNSKRAVFLGGTVGFGLQTTLEIMDGMSAEWGFSWSDMLANGLGTIAFSAQKMTWNEQRVLTKFSYHPTDYAALRPDVLGTTIFERLLKDYNGQTYWLSICPSSFLQTSKFPEWLCASIGYSVDQKLIGDKEYYVDPVSNRLYQSQRQWIVSLDIDFSKLPIRSPWMKKVVNQLNYLKIPFPALIFSRGKVGGSLLYF
jgi:hypothetical protein